MKPIYSSQSLPHVIFVVIYPRFSHFFFLRPTSTLNVEHCQLLCISLHKFWGGTSLLYMARITYNIEWAFNTSYVCWLTQKNTIIRSSWTAPTANNINGERGRFKSNGFHHQNIELKYQVIFFFKFHLKFYFLFSSV